MTEITETVLTRGGCGHVVAVGSPCRHCAAVQTFDDMRADEQYAHIPDDKLRFIADGLAGLVRMPD